MKRFLAAAKDDRVAALDAQRRRIDRHVRPRFVNEEDDAQRHADLHHLQTVRPLRRLAYLTHRVRQRGHLPQSLRGRGDPLWRESEAVNGRRIQPEGSRRGYIFRVGFEQVIPSSFRARMPMRATSDSSSVSGPGRVRARQPSPGAGQLAQEVAASLRADSEARRTRADLSGGVDRSLRALSRRRASRPLRERATRGHFLARRRYTQSRANRRRVRVARGP